VARRNGPVGRPEMAEAMTKRLLKMAILARLMTAEPSPPATAPKGLAPPPPRPHDARKADTLAKLEARHQDLWLASAARGGKPHLIPLSFAWDGTHLFVAVNAGSVSAANLAVGKVARAALGPTRDVVMLDLVVDRRWDVAGAPSEVTERYASQADWDPRSASGYVYFALRPTRIHAWREANEIAGRTIMCDGRWLP